MRLSYFVLFHILLLKKNLTTSAHIGIQVTAEIVLKTIFC